MSPMGRPTKLDCKKDFMLRVRVTSEFNKALDEYCEKNNVTKSEVTIKGISNVIGYDKKE